LRIENALLDGVIIRVNNSSLLGIRVLLAVLCALVVHAAVNGALLLSQRLPHLLALRHSSIAIRIDVSSIRFAGNVRFGVAKGVSVETALICDAQLPELCHADIRSVNVIAAMTGAMRGQTSGGQTNNLAFGTDVMRNDSLGLSRPNGVIDAIQFDLLRKAERVQRSRF
jgi:hypothetical protein